VLVLVFFWLDKLKRLSCCPIIQPTYICQLHSKYQAPGYAAGNTAENNKDRWFVDLTLQWEEINNNKINLVSDKYIGKNRVSRE